MYRGVERRRSRDCWPSDLSLRTPLVQIDVTVRGTRTCIRTRGQSGEVYERSRNSRSRHVRLRAKSSLQGRSQGRVEQSRTLATASRYGASWCSSIRPACISHTISEHSSKCSRGRSEMMASSSVISEAIAEYSSVRSGSRATRRRTQFGSCRSYPRSDAKRKAWSHFRLSDGRPTEQHQPTSNAGPSGPPVKSAALGLEKQELAMAGRTDLASQVRWVAREDGDGAGRYDIP